MKGFIISLILLSLLRIATADNDAVGGGFVIYFFVTIFPFMLLFCFCNIIFFFIAKKFNSNNVCVVNNSRSNPMAVAVPIAVPVLMAVSPQLAVYTPTGPPAYTRLK